MTRNLGSSSVFAAIRRITLAAFAALAVLAVPARGASFWWDGNGLASNNWNTLASWATAADGSGLPVAEPGASDVVYFNATPYNTTAVWCALNAHKSVSGMVFDNTATTWVATDGGGNRNLTNGANGIVVNAGAGTVTFGSTLTSYRIVFFLSASQTWLNNSANAVALNARSTVNLGANTLTLNGPGDFSFSGNIEPSGAAGSIVKNGAGTVTFIATNFMTGAFTLNDGRVRVGVGATIGAALGRGTLVLNGGTLSGNGTAARTISNNFTVGGNVTLGHAVDTGVLTFFGAGTLTGNRTLTVASDVVFSNAIGGAFTLTKAGDGVLHLAGANTYNNTLINAGVLKIASTAALPGWNIPGAYSVASNAALAVDNTVADGSIGTMLGTGNFADGARIGFDTAAADRIYGVNLADAGGGALGLAKVGLNALELTGNNTYSGGTDVRAGILRIGSATGLGTGPATFWAGTTFTNTSTMAIANAVNIASGAATVGVRDGTTLTLSGAVSGPGGLHKYGEGALTLAGSVAVSSNVIYAGTVNLNGTTLFGAGANNLDHVQVRGSSVLNIAGDTVFDARLRLAYDAGVTAVVNQTAGTVVYRGDYGQLIGNTAGSGFGVYNLFGGVLSNAPGAELTLGVNDNTTGIFNMYGGTLYTPTLEVGRNTGTSAGSTNYFAQSGGSATVETLVMGRTNADSPNQVMYLLVTGGTFTVTTGFTTLAPQSGHKATMYFGPGTDITLPAMPTARGAGATVDITFDGNSLTPAAASASYMTNLTSAAITDNGLTVNVPSGRDITIGQALADAAGHSGSLTKLGAGALQLYRANTFSGGIVVSNGTLAVGATNALGAGAVKMAAGTVLAGAASGAVANNIELLGNITLDASAGAVMTLNGDVVSGSARVLTKTGAGTVMLGGTNWFGGAASILNGRLGLASNGRLGDVTALVLTNGAALQIDNTAVNLGDRIADAAAIQMWRAALEWTHNAAVFTDYSETLGALELKGWTNRIVAARAAASGTSTLTFDSLSRDPGAYLWVDAEALGADNRNRIKFTTAPATVGGLLPTWLLLTNVVAGRVDLAEYDVTAGLRAPAYVDGESSWAAALSARPTSDQTLTAARSVNALVLDNGIDLLGPAADRNLNLDGPTGAAIVLQTGGFSAISNNGNAGYNVLLGANQATFHTLGNLLFIRGNDNNATIRGSAGFVKTGPGTLILQIAAQAATASNLTGVIRIDEGTLELRRPDAAGGAVLELNGGTLMLVTNSSSVFTSQDATPTNTPLVVSRSGTVIVARASSGGGVTHTMGNLSLANGVQLTLNYGANFNPDSVYGVRFDTMTLLGNATVNVRAGPGTGDGILYATNVTDNGSGYVLTVFGNTVIRSELRVLGTLALDGGLQVGPAGGGAAVVRAADGFTNVAGNILVGQGTLASGIDFARELGAGAGRVRFVGGYTAGISAGGAPAAFAFTQGGVTGMLAWGAPNFEIGTFQMNEDDAGAQVTLLNDLDLNVASGSTTRTFQVDGSVALIKGGVTNTGSGTANLVKLGGSTLWLTGPLGWNGTTRVGAGLLRVPAPGSLPAGNLQLNPANSYGVLESAGAFTRPLGNGNNEVLIVGTSTGVNNSRPGFGAVGGDLVVDIGGDGTGTGPMLVWNSAYFDPDGTSATNGALYLGSAASDGILYWKNAIDLNGTGEADVTDRRFQVEGASTIAVIEGAIVNNGPSPIGLQKKSAGTLVLAGANTYDGGTYVLGGTLVIGAGGASGTLGGGNVTNLGILAFNRGNNYTVNNLIVGDGAVAQMGAGVLTLTANNTYAGPTTVTNGTLRIQGAHTGLGLITVAGGRLEGNGAVAGAITVQSGATLAPGASAGQFSANANVTLQSGAIFEAELNGTTPGTLYDQLLMGGGTTLTLSNPTLSVVLGFTPAIDNTFQIVTGFSTLSGTFAGLPVSGSRFMSGGTEFEINYNSNDITLTVVPEPATLGTMGLALLAGALLRRRLRR